MGLSDSIRAADLSGPATIPSFAGTVGQTAPFLPGTSAGDFESDGPPVFFDADTDEPIEFDPFNLHADGETDGNSMLIVGNRRVGKTTAGQHIIALLAARKAANGERMTVTADIHRRNAGQAELDKAVKSFGSTVTTLKGGEYNIFTPGLLDYDDLLPLTTGNLEMLENRRMTVDEYQALCVAMWRMYDTTFEGHACPSLLMLLLINMEKQDVLDYRMAQMASYLESQKDNNAVQALLTRNDKLDAGADDIVAAAYKVAEMVDRLRTLSCIGDKHSLKDAMRQQFFAPDYTGLTDMEIVVMQTYFWRIKQRYAMATVPDPTLFYNLEFNDENYKLWRYLPYAEGQHDSLKSLRGVAKFVMLGTHRFGDYQTVGKLGSRQRELAMNMLNDISIFLIGKMPEKAREDTKLYTDMDDAGFDIVKALDTERHEWVLKTKDGPMRRVVLNMTPAVLVNSKSEAANDSMTIRREGRDG